MEIKSPFHRRALIWTSGVASTVLFALGTALFANAWSAYQAVGWVVAIVIGLGLAGWTYSTAAERAERARLRRLATTIPGPAGPLPPYWSPPKPEHVRQADVDDLLQRLVDDGVARDHSRPTADRPGGILAQAVAAQMLDSDATAPTAVRATYFDLRGLDLETAPHALAAVLFPAFGLGTPGGSETDLDRAATRLVAKLRVAPTLIVLANVPTVDAYGWLARAVRSAGRPPWVLVTDIEVSAEPPSDDIQFDPEAEALLRAFAELPSCEFDADAIAAVHTAVSPRFDRSLLEILNDLSVRGHLECLSGSTRYRLLPSVRDNVRDWQPPEDGDRTAAALPAVLQHYATQCRRWRAALHTAAAASTAAHWFRTEETVLRSLVTSTQNDSLSEPLVVIADALDLWYSRQQFATPARLVADTMATVLTVQTHPEHHALAELRGKAARRHLEDEVTATDPPSLPRSRLRHAILARHRHENGLRSLTHALSARGADRTRSLNDAARHLRDAWLALPRADTSGEIAVAINLAVVHLHQGRFDQANDRLALAADLARRRGDASGEAHVREMQGIAAWAGGRRYRAVERWGSAIEQYRTLEEQHGESRCLQHLATAVFCDRSLARLLDVDDDPRRDLIDERHALQWAKDWLERSLLLRPWQSDDPNESLAMRLLNDVRALIPHEETDSDRLSDRPRRRQQEPVRPKTTMRRLLRRKTGEL
jgi:hypothetical protein